MGCAWSSCGEANDERQREKVNHQMETTTTTTTSIGRKMLTVEQPNESSAMQITSPASRIIIGPGERTNNNNINKRFALNGGANSIGSFLSMLLQHKKRQKTVRVDAEWTCAGGAGGAGAGDSDSGGGGAGDGGQTNKENCKPPVREVTSATDSTSGRQPKGEHKFSKMQTCSSSSDQEEEGKEEEEGQEVEVGPANSLNRGAHETRGGQCSIGERLDSRWNVGQEEASLFVSVQQLCYEIIQERLLASLVTTTATRVLCLFVFGCQGSSKGELAFELVQHSPLEPLVDGRPQDGAGKQHQSAECCPLYQYIDVSALIVMNIDRRIAEYHQLVAQTMRTKRAQMDGSEARQSGGASGASGRSDDDENQEEVKAQEEEEEDEEDEEDDQQEARSGHEPSLKSQLSNVSETSANINNEDDHHHNHHHQNNFGGLVTLTTKQRSILQLKLIKYSNCLTSKWIFSLIEREVESFEIKLKTSCGLKEVDNIELDKLPARVYLVNLVPNQLSLFKCCLYLEQNLLLRDFSFPYYGIKFERRLNIKLLTKERAASEHLSSSSSSSGSQGEPHNVMRRLQLVNSSRFPLIKLPQLRSSSPIKQEPTQASAKSQQDDNLEPLAGANNLANNLNEKVGPKYQENFARQFELMNKLVRLRYNPMKNYNYFEAHPSGAHHRDSSGDEDDHHESDHNYCSRLYWPLDNPRAPSSLSMGSQWSSQELMQINHPRWPLEASSSGGLHQQRNSAALSCSPSASPSPTATAASYDASNAPVELLGEQMSSRVHLADWAPRLAIELELTSGGGGGGGEQRSFSPANRWRLSPYSRHQHHQRQQHHHHHSSCHLPEASEAQQNDASPHNKCLHVFRPPTGLATTTTTSGLRSPLSFASTNSSSPTQVATCSSHHYELISCIVEYPNGRHQSVLEVKRAPGKSSSSSSSGCFKVKAGGELHKLAKLIEASRVELRRDLDLWLSGAISELRQEQQQAHHNNNSQRRHSSAINHLHSTHQHQQQLANSQHSQPALPSLVVASIRVDISRLPTKVAPCETRLAPQAGAPEEPNEFSSLRPPALIINDHHLSNSEPARPTKRAARPAKRHVQFSLSPAPGGSGPGECHMSAASSSRQQQQQQHGNQSNSPIRAQRRLWLDSKLCESLFISCDDSHLFGQMDLFASLLCQSGLIVGRDFEASS